MKLLLRGKLAALLGILVLLVSCRDRDASPSVKGEAEKTYAQFIVIRDVRMSAAENFLGHTVTYLDAKVTNAGAQAVVQVELEMEFIDILNQVVLRETVRPVSLKTPPLKPGETRAFQSSFEHMPLDWNQGPPRFSVKSVQLR